MEVNEQDYLVKIYNVNETLKKDWDKKEKMFTGCCCVSDIELFYHCFECKDSKLDSYYAALMKYQCKHGLKGKKLSKWLDIGHNENYINAVKGVKSREFNTLKIDEKRGIITKTSRNQEKFIDEINWYVKLPNQLQYMIPRIYNYSLSLEQPFITMEYYGYITLHELYLYGNLDHYTWKRLFEEILFILHDMNKYIVKLNEGQKIDSMKKMYIDKTIMRMKQVINIEQLELGDIPILINDKQYKSWNQYIEILPTLVEEKLLKTNKESYNIIHGDLCFTNILVENNFRFLRLLDPRGRFGEFDLYGDSRYEIAKILHSIDGNYDLIIEDMFVLEIKENKLYFEITGKRDEIKELFFTVFAKEQIMWEEIKLIEALLFLSMIPLHKDYKKRQLAMLATGIQLLDRFC